MNNQEDAGRETRRQSKTRSGGGDKMRNKGKPGAEPKVPDNILKKFSWQTKFSVPRTFYSYHCITHSFTGCCCFHSSFFLVCDDRSRYLYLIINKPMEKIAVAQDDKIQKYTDQSQESETIFLLLLFFKKQRGMMKIK